MKKIKLKNNSKKKSYKKSIFKLFLFVLLIYISYSLTFNYLNKKNIDVRDKKYVDYLLENSYNNKNSKILLEEGISMKKEKYLFLQLIGLCKLFWTVLIEWLCIMVLNFVFLFVIIA